MSSLSFKEISELKKGDIVWESCQLGNIEIRLLEDAKLDVDSIRFIAECDEGEIDYLFTKNFYGTYIYTYPAYAGVITRRLNKL